MSDSLVVPYLDRSAITREEVDESDDLDSQSMQASFVFPIDRMWPTMFPYHEPTGYSVCGVSRGETAVTSELGKHGANSVATSCKNDSRFKASTSMEVDDAKLSHDLNLQLRDLHTRQLLDEFQIQEVYKPRDQIDGTLEHKRRMDGLERQLLHHVALLEGLLGGCCPPNSLEMAEHHERIAHLARSIGQGCTARPHLEQAIELRKEVHGPCHLTVANLLQDLGDFLDEETCHKEAMDRYIEALGVYQEILGPDEVVVGKLYFKLGTSIMHQGFLDQAIDFFQESLKIRKLHSGHDVMEIADVLETIGCVQLKCGKLEEASSNLLEALRRRRNQSDPMKLASTLKHVFNLFLSRHECQTAIGYFEEWLIVLGDLYSSVGHADEAVKFYREALTTRTSIFGGFQGCLESATLQAADCYFRDGDTLAAQDLYQEVLERNRDCSTPAAKEAYFYALLLIVHCHYLQGNTKAAKDFLHAAAEAQRDGVKFCVDMPLTVSDVLFRLLREANATSTVARVLESVKWIWS